MPESVTGDGYKTLPKSVRVGCYRFVIEVSENADSIAGMEFGHTNFMSQKIRLAPGMLNANLANTAIHEVLHCIHWVYGLMANDPDEETYTTLGANGLCAFFQDNPDFCAWFMKVNKA